LVRRRDAVIEFTARLDGEFDRPRELVVPQQFELILTGVFGERENIVAFPRCVGAFDIEKITLDARPLCFLRH
jgi:hypothetical protein